MTLNTAIISGASDGIGAAFSKILIKSIHWMSFLFIKENLFFIFITYGNV